MKKSNVTLPRQNGVNGNGMDTTSFTEGDLLLQALNGFVMVITAEALVFYASPTIQDYLGFHQLDVIHQSVFDLIHTDDRAIFRQQLHFALNPKPPTIDQSGDVLQSGSDTVKYDPEQLPPENSSFLERTFVCRFRCLLDNSSGFLALNFKGRLKYLHGQSALSDNGTRMQPQLALFTIAVPVQPPSILEIRTKTLIFQTRHKLDFTPMGIDSRGRVILGYSEIELCMKGSGYQFIHAADMMYCADNHIRMIKTGESGLTVFRLLTKSGVWMWVQANAKLVYKGGRPEFIIVRQRALVNAEGEDHLRQRRLQLPFNFTTGEALLYDTGPTLDSTQFQSNRGFNNKDKTDVDPSSLLGCFLSQDETIYTQRVEPSLPVDQVFMESRALVNVPSDPWQDIRSKASTDGPVLVKEEAERSVVAMIDTLEKMAQDGDLCAALQSLEVDTAELMEWENALKNLSQDNDQPNSITSELDNILTNEIFDYMDHVLFKESGEANLNANQPSCLAAVNNNQGEPFGQAAQPSVSRLCEPQLFQRPSADHTHSPVNGLCAQQQVINNRPVSTGQSLAEPAQILNSTQKLSHYGPLVPQTDANLPSLRQLQLQDIFNPSIELPDLTLPITSDNNVSVPFESCGQASTSQQSIPGQTQSNQLLQQYPHNCMQAPPMAANGQLLQGSAQQPNVAPSLMDTLPSLIPCNGFAITSPNESSTHSLPIPFPTACLQGSTPFQMHNNHRVQQWPQNQQQKLPPASIMQNGHNPMPPCHSQASENQRSPPAGLWPQSINRLTHTQQGGLADAQPSPSSTCMFDKRSHPLSNGSGLAPSGSSCQRRNDTSLDQSPPQGSCYFQWGQSEPVVGTSAIIQENAIISPPSHPLRPNMSSPDDILVMQCYLECNKETQNPSLPAESNGLFAIPSLGDVNMYFSDQTQTNSCNF